MRYFCRHFTQLGLLTLIGFGLTACANTSVPAYYQPAVNKIPVQEKTVTKYVPVAMPGQLIPVEEKRSTKRNFVGMTAVEAANKKATKRPDLKEYINSMMIYKFMPGLLYQIYCAPLNVTDIQFGPNERIISVAAGDTLRWHASKTYSGSGSNRLEHLLVKPIEDGLSNNLIVTTDARTYHLKLHSTTRTYMASVKWLYPEDSDNFFVKDLTKSVAGNHVIPQSLSVDVKHLDFKYRIKLVKGRRPNWAPVMIFNDGQKTYIQFPMNTQEAPTLFVGDNRDLSALVNYRIVGNYYIVDSLFRSAQLRMGQKYPTIIQINYIGN